MWCAFLTLVGVTVQTGIPSPVRDGKTNAPGLAIRGRSRCFAAEEQLS